MKGTLFKAVGLGRHSAPAAVAVLALSNTLGVCLGALAARWAEEERLAAAVERCLSAVETGGLNGSWLPLVWNCLRFPAAVFLCGFSLVGLGVIPLVLGAEGFTLAYSVAAFLRVYGLAGYPLALAAFGLGGLASLAALAAVGVPCFTASAALAHRLWTGRRAPVYLYHHWRLCALGGGLVLLRILMERFAVLPLLAAAMETL